MEPVSTKMSRGTAPSGISRLRVGGVFGMVVFVGVGCGPESGTVVAVGAGRVLVGTGVLVGPLAMVSVSFPSGSSIG
jgi:hypothetical protein